MKTKILPALLLLSIFANGQGNLVKITDTSNPVVTFANGGTYRGAAWIDINNDGLMDLHASPGWLFMNYGNGQFIMIANPITTGNAGNTGPASTSWSDFDNDGDFDCYVGTFKSRLFRNDGSGVLTIDTNVYSMMNDYTAWAGSVGDANNDARMDVVLAYANGFFPGTTPTGCIYFKQDVNGKLNTINGYAFTDSLAAYTVPYWSDFDLDGDMDLFVASGPAGTPGYDYCYRNLKVETGVDTMERITNTLFAMEKQDGQCYNFIDHDNDGDLDLCLSNYNGAPTRFYQNDNGTYVSLTLPFTNTGVRLANCWGDYDNDGDQDVILTTDGLLVKYYRNDGNAIYTSVALNMTTKVGGAGVSNCDYDNDGDLDVYIMGTGSAKGLYRNDSLGFGNNWINIKCIGTVSNKAAIGTTIRIKCNINGNAVWQIREINAQNSFMGHNDFRVHFGLGNATVIDSMIIKYLGGGTEIFTGVTVNQFYSNIEGSGMLSNITNVETLPVNRAWLFQVAPNPVKNNLSVEPLDKTMNQKVSYTISDALGKTIVNSTLWTLPDPLQINTSRLDSGVYFINIVHDQVKQSLQFVKQ